jgi:hypothetical protein
MPWRVSSSDCSREALDLNRVNASRWVRRVVYSADHQPLVISHLGVWTNVTAFASQSVHDFWLRSYQVILSVSSPISR